MKMAKDNKLYSHVISAQLQFFLQYKWLIKMID